MKKLITIILISLILIPTVYANGTTPHTSSDILTLFINLTNILWLPFAFIAGQLLTNDFVYGTFLGVDKVLWNIWNISRTAAMIILGVLFFRFIIMTFFSKEQGIKAIKQLPKIIIATLLVNLSFFLLGSLVDLSSILIGVAGQLPKTIVSEDTNNKRNIKVCNKYRIAGKAKTNSEEFLECISRTDNIHMKNYLDGIANASGLLIYLASSVLHVEQLSNIPGGTSMNLKSMTTATAIKVITSLLFIVPLIILIITNIIRIFRIWLYIAFAPLIAVDIVFGSKIGSKIPKSQAFTLSNILGMIFQPVLVVAALSLVVIFMTMLQITFQGSNPEGLKALQINMNKSTGNTTMTYGKNNKNLLTINGNIGIKDTIKSGFGQIIISLIGVLLMWGILKASFKFSKVTKSVSDGIFGFGESVMKTIPIVGGVGYGAIEMLGNRGIMKGGLGTISGNQAQPIINKIHKMFGIDKGDIQLNKKRDFLARLTGIERAKSKVKYLELISDIIDNGMEKGVNPAISPNFQETMYQVLKSLSTNFPEYKLFLDNKDKKEVNASDYFQNMNQPGVKLVMGMYLNKLENKEINFNSKTNFSSLRNIIQDGANQNPNVPFKPKPKS